MYYDLEIFIDFRVQLQIKPGTLESVSIVLQTLRELVVLTK